MLLSWAFLWNWSEARKVRKVVGRGCKTCLGTTQTSSFLGNENSAQSFSNRSFWKSLRVVDVRAFESWMSTPKCLFFQDFDCPDRSFWPGYPRKWPPDIRGMSVPKTSSLGWFFVLEFRAGAAHSQRTSAQGPPNKSCTLPWSIFGPSLFLTDCPSKQHLKTNLKNNPSPRLTVPIEMQSSCTMLLQVLLFLDHVLANFLSVHTCAL